ncbi:MAG: alanine--tRNA ligase [Salibacteraceae bacterium]
MNWTTHAIRSTFLSFFEEKGHKIVPSSPIVVKNDPTLMFTNAGMNQFKGVFLGSESPQSPRVANCQKCLRVSGKHNDLEEVGLDHYHHTMFEMLGNWSFGDYFKADAIAWAWELLTEVYHLDKSRIYVTVFDGDEEMGLGVDSACIEEWKKHVSADRILRFGRKDNFWEMGETGPCGPCSEIHYDLRPDAERSKQDAKLLVNTGHPEVIEIWNLVFIQYNRLSTGQLQQLSQRHVDTGMGLERLARVLQNKKSNYEIDIFSKIIAAIERETKRSYQGGNAQKDVAFRVIADHLRAISFCIADGQLPSNTGAGYVVRRILRRAIRFGFSALAMDRPYLYRCVADLVQAMGDHYPELKKQQKLIERVIQEEERGFLNTLERGLDRIADYLKTHAAEKVVDGAFAFELYDTYGFPVDLTKLIAAESGFTVDTEGFNHELNKQKNRSRSASKVSYADWEVVSTGEFEGFIGYDSLSAKTELLRYRKVSSKGRDIVQVVLRQTPFYAESGGQVGDIGTLTLGDVELEVIDTVKENNEVVHIVEQVPPEGVYEVEANVDAGFRRETSRHHTATHLLHNALRKVLGTHVEQRGSLVAREKLRFDFSHFQKVTQQELERIENHVNGMIRDALPLKEFRDIPLNEALEMGALALFGEKYGEMVRVIQFGDSIELCGGTHVSNTSDIMAFKLTAEMAVASGIRRIEAVCGDAFLSYVNQRLELLDAIENRLGTTRNLVQAIDKMLEQNEELQKRIEQFRVKEKNALVESWKRRAAEENVISHHDDGCDPKTLKEAGHEFIVKHPDHALVVATGVTGKPYLLIALGDKLIKEKGLNAIDIIRHVSGHIKGGGGGQPFLAEAGGKNKEGLQRALKEAVEAINKNL